MTKYVFVTGGVVSFGQGHRRRVTGAILESRGIKVTHLKLDPYINVDPGTMSPFQHGEVFVTEDGAETDLDLGTTSASPAPRCPSATISPLARSMTRSCAKERRGEYLGKTVQVIPTSPTKSRARSRPAPKGRRRHRRGGRHGGRHRVAALPGSHPPDGHRGGRNNTCYMHLTLLPLHPHGRRAEDQADPAFGQGTAEIGIQPDILLCRPTAPCPPRNATDRAVLQRQPEAVIECLDADSIYKIPACSIEQMIDEIVCHKLNILAKPPTSPSGRN